MCVCVKSYYRRHLAPTPTKLINQLINKIIFTSPTSAWLLLLLSACPCTPCRSFSKPFPPPLHALTTPSRAGARFTAHASGHPSCQQREPGFCSRHSSHPPHPYFPQPILPRCHHRHRTTADTVSKETGPAARGRHRTPGMNDNYVWGDGGTNTTNRWQL